MGSRQILFASLFAAAVSAFSTINRHHSDLPASVTAVLAKAAGLKYFGAATDNPELINTTYASVLYDNSIFEQQTPGNSQKWGPTEPENGTSTYTQGDAVVNAAITANQIVRCHNLVWYNQLPNWLTAPSNGVNYTKDELTSMLEAHIASEVTHYKGKCYCWDVVNEALNDDGTYRSDVFYNTLGEDYIPLAFQLARKYDADVKLYYNDYNIETAGAKSTAVHKIVSSLKVANVDIDGVGLQGHFIEGDTPTADALKTNLAAFTALGVEVAYTEVDVRVQLLDDDTKQAQQAKDYASIVQACVETESCVGVTVWDFYDPFSWVPNTFSGYGDADLVSSDFTVKPA